MRALAAAKMGLIDGRLMLRRVGALLFAVVCLVTAFLGALFILAPLLPLVFLRPPLWRSLADRLVGFWFSLPVVCLPKGATIDADFMRRCFALYYSALRYITIRCRRCYISCSECAST